MEIKRKKIKRMIYADQMGMDSCFFFFRYNEKNGFCKFFEW